MSFERLRDLDRSQMWKNISHPPSKVVFIGSTGSPDPRRRRRPPALQLQSQLRNFGGCGTAVGGGRAKGGRLGHGWRVGGVDQHHQLQVFGRVGGGGAAS